MKFEITENGAAGHEVGAIVDIKGDMVPGWLIGKGRVVTAKAAKVAVTNPAEKPVQEKQGD